MFHTVASISSDQKLIAAAVDKKLSIYSVSWEDTARNKNSCFGPNITDLSLFAYSSKDDGACFPMIRRPNFGDENFDCPVSRFKCRVGNEKKGELVEIDLKSYLTDIGQYIGRPEQKSLYLPRDSVILTSMQYCILPLHDGTVDFAVQMFNYQSYPDNPAILVIVISEQGTSAQIVTERHQKILLNIDGQSHSFQAKRLEDDRKERKVALEGAMSKEEKEKNALFIIQVPLKQKVIPRPLPVLCGTLCCDFAESKYIPMSSACQMAPQSFNRARGLDHAILSQGESRGVFTGVKDSAGKYMDLVRDDRYPIRCTIQKYQVTDSAIISPRVFELIDADITKLYKSGEATGSLVTEMKTDRKTEAKELDSAEARWATAAGINAATKYAALLD